MRPAIFSFPAVATTAICALQVRTGAGALVLDGTLQTDRGDTVTPGFGTITLAGIQRTLTLTSTGNLSALTFTIVGTSIYGAAVTEAIAGPNNTTVTTTAQFHTISSISVDATIGTAVSIGTGSVGQTSWYMADNFIDPANITVAVAITATVNVTVRNTPDDVQTNTSPTTFDHATLAALTASAQSNYAFPPRYIQAVMNSSSGSGAFTMTIIQAG